MAAVLHLPPLRKGSAKDRETLSVAVRTLVDQALPERNAQHVGWTITDAYFRGLRAFHAVDYHTGEVTLSWEDEEGDLHCKWEEVLTKLQTEVGRLSRLDVSPQSRKRTHSLDSLRGASVAQVVLDNMCPRSQEDLFKVQFFTGLCLYGTYAQAAWQDPDATSPLAIVRELIPPWELLSVPADYRNPTDLRGVIRIRPFSLPELERLGLPLPDSDELLEIREIPYGAEPPVTDSGSTGGGGSYRDLFDRGQTSLGGGAGPAGRRTPERDTEKFTRLQEAWLLAPGGAVARYISMAGRWILESREFPLNGDARVPFPIGISRYHETGRFYGRSFASKLLPFALEMEALLERLIQSAADMNRFGFIMVPNNLGINLELFKDTTAEPRIVPYETDLAMPDLAVSHIAPPPITDVGGRTFNLGISLFDRLVSQGPLYSGEAPGRADSGVAFGALVETGATHLLPVAVQVEESYTTVFRSMLHLARNRAISLPDALTRGLELSRLENTIAGVTIDSSTGRMILSPDALPSPWSTDLGIRSRDPVSVDRRRSEAVSLLSAGLLSPLEFIILNYKENWDYPVGNRAVWENYVKAVLINLIMFGDGQTPGQLPQFLVDDQQVGVFFSDVADKAEVHLLAVEDFIAGPEFSLSSPTVQDAFYERVTALRSQMGQRGLPPQAPTLDQAVVENVARRESTMPRSAGNRRATAPAAMTST